MFGRSCVVIIYQLKQQKDECIFQRDRQVKSIKEEPA